MSDTQQFGWDGRFVWDLEDMTGHVVTVDVEPRIAELVTAGTEIVIDGEWFRVLRVRADMVAQLRVR